MFNGDLKKEAIERLNQSAENYRYYTKTVKAASAELFVLRKKSSEEVIGEVEAYINTLTNRPKEFDRSFAEYKAEFREFTHMLQDLQTKSDDIDFEFGTAMAIATTFGTASTGAIAALSGGAAATNAALAWLGGGALAAGGGGMIAGEALLALAGPIGWAIGGAAIVGGGLLARSKNEKIANEANAKRKEVEVLNTQLKAAEREVNGLISLTKTHVAGVKDILSKLKSYAFHDYHSFTPEAKNELTALLNHIQSLSKLLNKKVVA